MDIYLLKVVCVVCTVLLNATGSLTQLNVCSQDPVETKIVGGEDASPGSWPWQVSIQVRGSHHCGGSLITEKWVLSAAHCFQRFAASDITVYLGMGSMEGTNPNKQERSASNIIIHEEYNNATKDNDIALVQLSSAVTLTSYVMMVCLAKRNSVFPGGTNAWVTGWGNIASEVALPPPRILQKVQVPIVSNNDCAKAYGSGSITDSMMCAGLVEGGKDSCQGDSGGPLVVKDNGVWVQAGIVSFGKGCAEPKYPGVYTRVSQYQDWINSRISSNKPGFETFYEQPHSYYLIMFVCPFLLIYIVKKYLLKNGSWCDKNKSTV
ncbi:hypothetical protein KOW79_001469 [Hemibagrus wyckioides]|uniref:Peptidase S1 domain-containing protein n=1 Tax=Hemibagrus wyckioides TaxID=337641 RepID=A0A9D3P8M5_9TELE|nr:serine protease 33-like [Hemibagrus wyckioides]KAG7334873.1 hypothetical protein KOW79_001469 [Hemibagrus wyckioides]